MVYKQIEGNLIIVSKNRILKWPTQRAINFFLTCISTNMSEFKLINRMGHVRQLEQPKQKLWNILKALSKNKKDVVFPLLERIH